jgi:hypothetical protein
VTTVLRTGTSGEWKARLSASDIRRIQEELGPLMTKLRYEMR